MCQPVFLNFYEAQEYRFHGIDYTSLAGQYNNPIPTWFLVPIDCSKNPAQGEDKGWAGDLSGGRIVDPPVLDKKDWKKI